MAAVVSPSMPAFAAGDDDLLRVLNAVEIQNLESASSTSD